MQIYHVLKKYCAVVESIMSPLGVSQQHQLCEELCFTMLKSGNLPQHPLVPDEAQADGDQPHHRQLHRLCDWDVQHDYVCSGNSWAVAGEAGNKPDWHFWAVAACQEMFSAVRNTITEDTVAWLDFPYSCQPVPSWQEGLQHFKCKALLFWGKTKDPGKSIRPWKIQVRISIF